MSRLIDFRPDGTVHVDREDGYTYIIQNGMAHWRYITGDHSSIEVIPYETGLRKPPPQPSAPLATAEQIAMYNQSIAVRKIGLLFRLLKARKEKVDF